jgi:hypothetical protein
MTAVRPTKQQRPRVQLAHIKARYDDSAMPPAVFAAIKQLETKIAWSEHCRQEARHD